MNYGQAATLTGTVLYETGATWKPLAGTPVTISRWFPGPAGSPVTAVTGTDGTFTASLPDQDTNGAIWEAVVGPVYPFFEQGTANAPLIIDFPTAFTALTGKLLRHHQVQVNGCLQVTAPGLDGPTSQVEIQSSPGRHGPWASLGSLHLVRSGSRSCRQLDQSYFSGTLGRPSVPVYYRAVYQGESGYQPATSYPVLP